MAREEGGVTAVSLAAPLVPTEAWPSRGSGEAANLAAPPREDGSLATKGPEGILKGID